jgi:hypothetical protein
MIAVLNQVEHVWANLNELVVLEHLPFLAGLISLVDFLLEVLRVQGRNNLHQSQFIRYVI